MEILSPLWHGFKTSLCIEQNKHFKYWSATIATKLHCPSSHLIKGTSSPPPSMCSVTLRQQGHAWIFRKHILQLLGLLKLSTKNEWRKLPGGKKITAKTNVSHSRLNFLYLSFPIRLISRINWHSINFSVYLFSIGSSGFLQQTMSQGCPASGRV